MLVAPAAVAPPGQHKGLGGGHVADDLIGVGVPHHGAQGHLDDQVLPVLAGAAPALSVHAVARGVFALVAEVHQGGHMAVHLEKDVSSPASIAAVGPAGGHVLFPVEGHGPVAAVAGLDGDFGGIHECWHCRHLLT